MSVIAESSHVLAGLTIYFASVQKSAFRNLLIMAEKLFYTIFALLVFIAITQPVDAYAAVGYWSAGACHESLQLATDGLASYFPNLSNGYIYHLTAIAPNGSNGANITVMQSSISNAMPPVSYNRNVYFSYCNTLTAPINLSQIFAMPKTLDIGTSWMLGFSTPVIIYLVSWGYGVVINSFRNH
ncbi:MAG: hypothetical protein PHI29_13305 [Gallionella sp.]|nr:hypothetical protein [Gallionella sp.]